MKLKDIEVGVMYAVTRYAERSMKVTTDKDGRVKLADKDYDSIDSRVYPAMVTEVGVQVGHYERPGVRVVEYDRHTMTRTLDSRPLPADGSWHHGAGVVAGPKNQRPPYELRAVQVIVPWDQWLDLYHAHVEAVEEEAERKNHERALEQARRQEQAAKDWMKREFAYAREIIVEVMEIIEGEENYEPSDGQVQALVEHRNPDGNPYLNGTSRAY